MAPPRTSSRTPSGRPRRPSPSHPGPHRPEADTRGVRGKLWRGGSIAIFADQGPRARQVGSDDGGSLVDPGYPEGGSDLRRTHLPNDSFREAPREATYLSSAIDGEPTDHRHTLAFLERRVIPLRRTEQDGTVTLVS